MSSDVVSQSTTGQAKDQSTGRGLRVALIAVLVGAVLLVGVLASRFDGNSDRRSSALIGQPLPASAFTSLDTDVAVRLDAMRPSDGVLVVNFWAPWCVPCVAEHAELNVASVRLDEDLIQIVGVPVHAEESEVRRFLQSSGQGYPILLDEQGRGPIDFGVFGVPETFFVGPDGTIAARVTGPVTADLIAELTTALLAGIEVDSVESGPIQSPP